MANTHAPTTTPATKVKYLEPKQHQGIELDLVAIDAVRKGRSPDAGEQIGDTQRADIIRLLNGSLATELVCVLRYKRHHFTARGLASPKIADEFLVHANEEAAHADRLAQRIVQLGGKPDFSPDALSSRSHAAYDDSTDLKAMIRANLVAERIAIECYSQMIALVGDSDPTTRRLLEDLLAAEQGHADELGDWLGE